MRKEVILAIIVGVGLGLVLTFGIWTANKALLTKGGSQELSPTPSLNETPTPSAAFELTILSPEEGDLLDKDSVLVSGTSTPGVNLVVLSENDEKVILADETGKWETTVKLVSGANDIRIVAYEPGSDQQVEKTITVVYSTKFEAQ